MGEIHLKWKSDADWKATVDENLRTGFLELLILQFLCERDMYAYELKRILGERTNNEIQFGEAPLYIPLLRLADRGLISSRKEFVTGKRFRTYYHIEELGRRYLAYGKERYKLLTHHVNRLLNWEESANEKPQ